MVTSLDYAGVYERVRGDCVEPPETAYCTLSRSTNLNANLALWSLPGFAPRLGQAGPAGTGAALPPCWARPCTAAPGLCPGKLFRSNKPSPSWSQQREEFSCPHPEGSGGELPAPGSRERWM